MNKFTSSNDLSINLDKSFFTYVSLAILTGVIIALNIALNKTDAMLAVIAMLGMVFLANSVNKIVTNYSNVILTFEGLNNNVKSVKSALGKVLPKPGLMQKIETTEEEAEFASTIMGLLIAFVPMSIYGVFYFYGQDTAFGVVLGLIAAAISISALYILTLLVKNIIKVSINVTSLVYNNKAIIASVVVSCAIAVFSLISLAVVILAPLAYTMFMAVMVKFGGETGYTVVSVLFAAKLVSFAIYYSVNKLTPTTVTSLSIVKQIIEVEAVNVKHSSSVVKFKQLTKGNSYKKYKPEKSKFILKDSLSIYGAYASIVKKGLSINAFKEKLKLREQIDDSMRSMQLAL